MRCWHPWFRIYYCAEVERAYGWQSLRSNWIGYVCLEEITLA